MIIGLTGYAQSGKDTVAGVLVDKYGFTRVAFADKIREFLYSINPMIGGEPLQIKVDVEGWEKAKKHTEVRRLLQVTGVSARKIFGSQFWVNQTLRHFATESNVVVTDVRFTNEAQFLQANGGHLWRVQRVGVGAVNGHISETELDDYPVDQIIVNNGTIEDLELLIKTRMQGLL